MKELLGRDSEIENLAKHHRRESRAADEKAKPAAAPKPPRSADDGFLFLLRLAALADALWRPVLALIVLAALVWLGFRFL